MFTAVARGLCRLFAPSRLCVLPTLVSLSLLVGSSARAASGEWPEFRGPTGQGLSEAKNTPVEWSAEKNISWRVEIPGGGWSSPVLSHDRLYLTTALPAPDGSFALHALCLNPSDGSTLWDTEVFHKSGSLPGIHQKNSQASPTPIVRDGKLYVHFGHLGTAALDLSGRVLWRQETIKYIPIHGNGGSPVLVDGLLVFSCDAASDPFVVALDASSGDIRWKKPRDTHAKKTFSFCTPLVIDVNERQELILPGSGFVGSYNPKTGDRYWKVRYGEGYSVVPRPVYAHGLLFLSSGFDNAVLYAINPQGAEGDATETHVAWKTAKAAPLTPSTLVVGDNLYYVSDSGIATCADPATGKVFWSERLGGDFSSSPVFADGRVYFQNESGVGFVVKEGRTFELLSRNDLAERSLASYAVADAALYIRTSSHLWKVATPRRAATR